MPVHQLIQDGVAAQAGQGRKTRPAGEAPGRNLALNARPQSTLEAWVTQKQDMQVLHAISAYR